MNRIAEINATSLSGLEELQELDLGRQSVPLVIRNGAFGKQRLLKKLVLGSNPGLQLEPEAFVGLSGLQALYLDYCSLKESILRENYLEPLSALESLNLFGNQIKRIRPAMFFSRMTSLKDLNLKLNTVDKLCESDLVGFRGKHFRNVNLDSVQFKTMSGQDFDWKTCGNAFRGMSFQFLDLSRNGFNVAKSKRFFKAIGDTKISHLKLSGHMGKGFSYNNLRDPDHSTFEGLRNSSVLTLDLSKSRIFALQQGVFSPLKEVVIIDVSQNRVNQIHRNAFDGLQGNLKMLNLSHNLLGEIYSYTFASLTHLRVLDLSYNHIGALGHGSFAGLPNLKALFLTGNSLRDVGVPASLPRLQFLLLNENKLAPSPSSALTQFARNITFLNLEENRLTDLGDVYMFVTQLQALQTLLYGGNMIQFCSLSRRVSAIGLNNLQVLDLHSSSLQSLWSQGSCLNVFDNLGDVAGVNLSSNALQSLPRDIFKGLRSVVEMDLSLNSLTYLQADVLPSSLKVLYLSSNFIASPDPAAFRSLRFLNLNSNRFHCDPNLESFLTWLNQTNVTFLSPVEELRCEFPFGFYKVPLIDYSAQLTQQ